MSLLLLAALLAACASDPGLPAPGGAPPRSSGVRDIDELQRIAHTPRTCDDDEGCPAGSHCDATANLCAWECLGDAECGTGEACTLGGVCAADPRAAVYSARNENACAAIPSSTQRAALLALDADSDPPACNHDGECICGAYCSDEARCDVECLPASDTPPPALTCPTGKTCSPTGRCQATGTPPPPPVQLSVELAPRSASTVASGAAVLMPVTVTITASSVDIVLPTDPTLVNALVKLMIADRRNQDPGAPPPVFPRVKCTASGALQTACALDNGWQFTASNGTLRSLPRTIWVEVPQGSSTAAWTLEARNALAPVPARMAVHRLAPNPIPTTDPGRYSGTMKVVNRGASADANGELELPIEAIVTASHIALIEPTRVLFPDGQLVLSRAAGNATLLPWLTSTIGTTTSTYRARFDFLQGTYAPATGKLSATAAWTSVAGDASSDLRIELERTFAADPACALNSACGAGSHCDVRIGRCLPGPENVGAIVADATAAPDATLPSPQVAAWLGSLPTDSVRLGGTGITGFERAYCYDPNPNFPGFARFDANLDVFNLATPSSDHRCRRPGVVGVSGDYPQTTFNHLNVSKERINSTVPGQTFDLLEKCLADLQVLPSDSNPLAPRPCANLAQFFVAIKANVSGTTGQPMNLAGQRLFNNLLRQWLGVSSYVASSTVQARRYADVLEEVSDPAHERLRTSLDLVEQSLRVLLDAKVKPQFASGADLRSVTTEADYRWPARPIVRWTFNNGGTTAVSSEVAGTTVTVPPHGISAGLMFSDGTYGSRCTTSSLGFLPAAVTTNRFTISFNPKFSSFTPGSPGTVTAIKLFEKVAADGHVLALDGWVTEPMTLNARLNLRLRDSAGATVLFQGIPAFPAGGTEVSPSWGLLAVVLDGSSRYILRSTDAGVIETYLALGSSTGTPSWGGPGTASFACDVPAANTCTSFHRTRNADYLDVVTDPAATAMTPEIVHTVECISVNGRPEQCEGPNPLVHCGGSETIFEGKSWLLSTLPADLPAQHGNAITFAPGISVEPHTTTVRDGETVTKFKTFKCRHNVTNIPRPRTRQKPVCGSAVASAPVSSIDGIGFDEVSFWDRALTTQEFTAMAGRYLNNKTAISLPAQPATAGAPPLPSTDHAVGLPAHLLEAAGADLDLLSEYIEAERVVMYEECRLGGSSAARDRVLERAGRHLRLVSVLEGEAARLAALPNVSTAPWYARYQGAQKLVAGRRTRALAAFERARACENPLGISEENLALYYGDAVGENGKFFASSKFLAAAAATEVGSASGFDGLAHDAYINQRTQEYQIQLTEGESGERKRRERAIRRDYEGVLRAACGVPSGGGELLASFLAGTMTAESCFYRTELAECSTAPQQTIRDVPARCLRGDLGGSVLEAQGAILAFDHAVNDHDRAQGIYEAKLSACRQRQAFHGDTQQLIRAHNEYMQGLRKTRTALSGIGDFLGGAGMGAQAFLLNFPGKLFGAASLEYDLAMADEQVDYELMLTQRHHHAEIQQCFRDADLQRFTILDAQDVIKGAMKDLEGAIHKHEQHKSTLAQLPDEAAGQLSLEGSIDRVPPHFHYWLDQSIVQYHHHLEYARRLSYLAVRAFEYEAQESTTWGAEVLAAPRHEDLGIVVDRIARRTAPILGNRDPEDAAIVLSLAREIMRLPDLSSIPSDQLPPGTPRRTPEEQFNILLNSPSSKFWDGGNYKGHAIHFSMAPSGWSEVRCAERIWRVTVAIQTNNSGTLSNPALVLYQMNAFGSQLCDDPDGTPADHGIVVVRRFQDKNSLLVGESTSPFPNNSPHHHTNVDGPSEMQREQLRAFPNNGGGLGFSPGLAGRGVFGEYVLVFPEGEFPPSVLASVNDVLIRFDITNLPR